MDWGDLSIVMATFLGPVVAIIMTRYMDNARAERDRKLYIFRMLMKDRRNGLSSDFVSALNLIEVEFHKDKKVVAAWKSLWESFCHDRIDENDPLFADKHDKLARERTSKITKLLSEMGKVLNLPIEQLDILDGGYAPEGWRVAEREQRELQAMFLSVLSGQSPISISISSFNGNTMSNDELNRTKE